MNRQVKDETHSDSALEITEKVYELRALKPNIISASAAITATGLPMKWQPDIPIAFERKNMKDFR